MSRIALPFRRTVRFEAVWRKSRQGRSSKRLYLGNGIASWPRYIAMGQLRLRSSLACGLLQQAQAHGQGVSQELADRAPVRSGKTADALAGLIEPLASLKKKER